MTKHEKEMINAAVRWRQLGSKEQPMTSQEEDMIIDFLVTVERMRKAQKAYFANRKGGQMREAIALEKEVDAKLATIHRYAEVRDA